MRRKITLGVLVGLVVALAPATAWMDPLLPLRRVNVPYFPGKVDFSQMAIFWFGQVTPTTNYTDARVAYTDQELIVHLAIFDRLLWYDPNPSAASLTDYDGATLYLSLVGNNGQTLAQAYRFDSQLNDNQTPRQPWQAAYTGSGSTWTLASRSFTTDSYYAYEDTHGGVNNNQNNRGWRIAFHIPFASLGLSSRPQPGTVWGLALAVHDRDEAQPASPKPDQVWPENVTSTGPASWGQLYFGLPTYTHQSASAAGTVTIRNKLNGAQVIDGMVGGSTICGGDWTSYPYWSDWGTKNYSGTTFVNVQNLFYISDWPCFSKYYVAFPLTALPASKVIVSATLTLHQFGNAGAEDTPEPSYIQVLTVGQDWNKGTLNWNNAPLARENIAAIWVDPLSSDPGHLGVPRTWDVSRAVAEAYGAGQPLRLAVYSADYAYNSGRYFWSSDYDDYSAEARPTLTVVWGEPLAVVHKTVWPVAPSSGKPMTYTLHFLGSGVPLTLTDSLPSQVSSPGRIQVEGGGAAAYLPGSHQITWTGNPTVGQSITLTFPVTATVHGPLVIRNSALLTDAWGNASTDEVVSIVDARRVLLPLIRR